MSPSHQSQQQTYCPECAVCKKSVTLEESKSDEYGQSVHEECYVAGLGKIFAPRTIQLANTPLRHSDSNHIAVKIIMPLSWR